MPLTDPLLLVATLARPNYGRSYDSEWKCADDIRGMLVSLGYETTAQVVASRLRRLSREKLPTIEVRQCAYGSWNEYRVTQYGKTLLRNRIGMVSF